MHKREVLAMTAVIYARYSSDNQREESIEGQIRECTAYAEKNAGELRYIVPGECHIVLVEHLQSAHNIILRKAVDILHAHIVIGFQQGESVMAQLLLTDPALLCVNRQRHNTVETVANPDLVSNTV